jgi:hypothetical protein
MSIEQELLATSDALLRILDRLHELESEKRELPTGSRRFVELATQIDDLAVEVLRRTERQEELAQDMEARREAGGAPGRPIDDLEASKRTLVEILEDWRNAERRLASADPGSPESSEAAARVRQLREEYRLAQEERKQP